MAFIRKEVKRQSTNCNRCYYKSDDPNYSGIYVRGCEAPYPMHKPCGMAYKGYWDKPFNPIFRIGDKLKFITKGFDEYGKIFVAESDSQIFPTGDEVIFCKNLSSAWNVDNFQRIK